MAIEAELADGRILEFPDGTDPLVIQQAVKSMLAQQPTQQAAQPQTDEQFKELSLFEQFKQLQPDQAQIAREQILEPAVTIGTGAGAEIAGGAAGVGALLRGAGPEVAQQEIEQTREALTFQPRSEAAKQTLGAIGETLAPAGEFLQEVRQATGDIALKATGSPAFAAIATALPDATIEALGFGIGRKFAQAKTGLKGAPDKPRAPGKVKEGAVTKSLLEAAPEVEQIKEASRAIYKEIDDLNVTTKPMATNMLVNKVVKEAEKANVDKVLTPDSARVVELLKKELDDPRPRSISDLDSMRQKAQQAAGAIKPADARIGAIMIDEIDDFLDNLPQNAFTGPDAQSVKNIGERFKAARGLWGRARRAELVNEAMSQAELARSGFENGLRNELNKIVRSPKRRRFFTADEIDGMRDVIKGSDDANILKLVGRLGLSEGGSTNILGALGGTAVLGPISPVIGQVSKKFAQKTTQAAAQNVEALVRSGAQSRKIATAYMQSVPKAKRSVQDLTDLLLSSGSEVDDLLTDSSKFVKEAAEIARARKTFQRAEAAGAAVPAALPTEEQ